ncbi:MAG: phage integrase N-terminal SAM-like domain-containing protein [Deltaproteobacteria bacterium]|nr:phage integrase N-terminal SAM-like domain-containing protein [Deltaproteobacteria bacterium]
MDNPTKRLLDQVRDLIRVKHYSIRTEQACIDWIKRFIYFHDKKASSAYGGIRNRGFFEHQLIMYSPV